MSIQAENVAALSGRLAGVIWGDAKTGKTTWACSLPGRKLLINFDPDGFSSVAYREDVDVIDLSTLPATEAIQQAKKVGQHILDNAEKYESIIVDSLTTLVDLSLHDAVQRGIGKGRDGFTPTIDTPGLAAYGARNNSVNDIVSKLLRASGQKKLHCFFIAHSDDPEYSHDGKTIIQQTIMLSAKIRNMTALKVSEIYHLAMDSDRRTVYTAPFGLKKPMGSRIFNTTIVKKFSLHYSPDKPDDKQPCSLQAIVKTWTKGGFAKCTAIPGQ